MKPKNKSKYEQEGRVVLLADPGVKELLLKMVKEDHRRSMSNFLNALVIDEYFRRHPEEKQV